MRVDVVQPLGLVESGMHQDRIARLCPPFPDDTPVAQPRAVVGLQEAREAGLLARALIVGRVNMQRTPSLGRAAARCGSSPARCARSGRSPRPDRSTGTGTRIPSPAAGSGCCRQIRREPCSRDSRAAGRRSRRRFAPGAAPVARQVHRPPGTPPRPSHSDSHPRGFPTRSPGSRVWGARRRSLPASVLFSAASPHGSQEETQETWIRHGWHSTRDISGFFPNAAQHTPSHRPGEQPMSEPLRS